MILLRLSKITLTDFFLALILLALSANLYQQRATAQRLHELDQTMDDVSDWG